MPSLRKDVKVENVFIELFVDEEGNVSVGHWGFVVLAVIPTDIN